MQEETGLLMKEGLFSGAAAVVISPLTGQVRIGWPEGGIGAEVRVRAMPTWHAAPPHGLVVEGVEATTTIGGMGMKGKMRGSLVIGTGWAGAERTENAETAV